MLLSSLASFAGCRSSSERGENLSLGEGGKRGRKAEKGEAGALLKLGLRSRITELILEDSRRDGVEIGVEILELIPEFEKILL